MALIINHSLIEYSELQLDCSTSFIFYIVENEPNRLKLLDTIKMHSQKRNRVVEEISIVNDDIDGPAIIENDICHYGTPTWWHTEAFVTIVHDLVKIANEQELYPKFSRLISLITPSSFKGDTKRMLPEGSILRAIITENELDIIQSMFRKLGESTRSAIRTFQVKRDNNGYWQNIY